jgi:hypothetical protein
MHVDNEALRKLVEKFEMNILVRNKAQSPQKMFYRKKKITVVYSPMYFASSPSLVTCPTCFSCFVCAVMSRSSPAPAAFQQQAHYFRGVERSGRLSAIPA